MEITADVYAQSSSFRFGFLGFRERLFALHSGHIGALRCIC